MERKVVHRKPDYHLGRFFLSPLLGCTARCSFCYIFSNPHYSGSQQENSFGARQSVEWIAKHPEFRQGVYGSIIAIGAWGDPFPASKMESHAVALEWLRCACELGNPIQLMSRFEISDSTIDAIVAAQKFPRQILYSTSVITFQHWSKFERGTDSPLERLRVLKDMKSRGVPTNVMIKPFIPGVTDVEEGEFVERLSEACVEYCVVGTLQWDDGIISRMQRNNLWAQLGLGEAMNSWGNQQILDCSSTSVVNAFQSSQVDDFAKTLSNNKIKVFKKSACVTSHVLQAPNAELLYLNDHHNFCVKCGVCDKVDGNST